MFNNWINFAELFHVLQRVRREGQPICRRIAGKLRLSNKARIKASWSQTDSPAVNWWDIPAVHDRWNRMISGDENTDHHRYVAEKFCRGKDRLKGVSLGCGAGSKEILWARTGAFASIDAYDLSEQQIDAAIESCRGTPEADVVHYRVGDISRADLLPKCHYDVVICEHSIHHFTPLESLVCRIRESLVPDGLLVANEFVGPTRFQWTDRQLEVVNALLRILPHEYKTLLNSSDERLSAICPSRLWMWLSDPSEAVESSNILPLLHKHFRTVEVRGYGGAILSLLFSGIAHHFIRPDACDQQLLNLCFAVEDVLLARHEIGHDFVLAVCRA